MARPDPAAELAQQMIAALRAWPAQAPFPTLGRLRPDIQAASDALVLKAVKKKPFADEAIVLQPRNLQSPVAGRDDIDRLLRSDEALVFLLALACSPEKPAIEPGKLRLKLPAPLRAAWDQALSERLAEGDLPAAAALVQQGKKRLLHWRDYPLPKKPEERLAQALLGELSACRQRGSDYPLPLARLLEKVDGAASAALWKKALALPEPRARVLFGVKQGPAAPVTLRDDRELLVASDLLLLTALKLARAPDNEAVGAADLKRKVARELQPDFAAALAERVAARRRPPGIGCVLHKKKPLFFLLDGIIAGEGTPANELPQAGLKQEAIQTGADFRVAFDAAFDELDRRRGGHNFVSLVGLRAAVKAPPEQFDRQLQELRRAGSYTLSAAEGRHGISPEEQAAGIPEDGALLLYVSRRK